MNPLKLDLSYIDVSSESFARFKARSESKLNGGSPYVYKATEAVYMFLTEGSAEWDELAVQLADEQVLDAETEIALGRTPKIAHDSYLKVGEMITDIVLVENYCTLTTEQRARFRAYREQAVWNIWNFPFARWGDKHSPWNGWSILNENPGNNYYYSFIWATAYHAAMQAVELLTSTLPVGGTDWMNELKTNRIPKIIAYYQASGEGGGSREGTGYGTSQGSLFAFDYFWFQLTGQNLADTSEHLAKSIDYWIHATLPGFKFYAPIGDLSRQSYPYVYDYHRSYMLNAQRMAPQEYADRAAWWLEHALIRTSGSGGKDVFIPGRMTKSENLKSALVEIVGTPVAPTALYHYSKGAGHLFARRSWNERASWFSFIAGRFDESHAHQDQGSFMIFRDDFLAIDSNMYSHSGTIGTIQSGIMGIKVHNMLRFDKADGTAINQKYQTETEMLVEPGADGAMTASADITPLYPVGSGVSWNRKLIFANNNLEVIDNFLAPDGVDVVWQCNTVAQPVIEDGINVRAGRLLIKPIGSGALDITITDLTTLEYAGGFLIEIRGGQNGYHFMLETEAADLDTEEDPPPPANEEPATPPIGDEPMPEYSLTTVPTFPADIKWIHIAKRDQGTVRGKSWHYQGPSEWIPVEQLQLDDLVATCTLSADGKTCVGAVSSAMRIWEAVKHLGPDRQVHGATAQPKLLDNKDGADISISRYVTYVLADAPEPVEPELPEPEAPDTTVPTDAELQTKVDNLSREVARLLAVKLADNAEFDRLESEIDTLNRKIDDQAQVIVEIKQKIRAYRDAELALDEVIEG